MALTETQLIRIRRIINDVDEPQMYSDDELNERFVEVKGNYDQLAYDIWIEKASAFSTLVNTSESGSSRSTGDLYKNAVSQANFYKGRLDDVEEVATADATPFTVQSERT
jgi:hypothetical protein